MKFDSISRRHLLQGTAALSLAASLPLQRAFAKETTIGFIYVGSREDFEVMNGFFTKHQIRPVIDRTFAFEEAEAAFRYMESGAHFGKVVIQV